MTTSVTIDIFSDVMCPWCVIGYKQLEQALATLDGEIAAEVRWHAFELNPDMPPEGEELAAHMLRKYGRAPDAASTAQMVGLAEQAGYDMRYLGPEPEPERRLFNTFLAHKLLRWALVTAGPEAQTRLKLALFDAYFQQRRDVSDRAVLLAVVAQVGLDGAAADAALDDPALAQEVRAEQQEARAAEINAVPAMIIEGRYLIPGAQGAETYVELLRKVAARAGSNPT
ncbi:DsbA family oxidoreductase [Novosphingobium sp. JCM 18896]|uniref:DsbA family oxidoreductase n=1 Tax=Novosphingobium sp. JCM 18896 TaxID=2989731 RepID=UPI002221E9F6|nr:DsbA family oxidoreductase [Novosphingobium sp. JCM 18896]MCW1430472.1 DsbA family oxidoreductase [Novosphingobium sp. JCM 18896]